MIHANCMKTECTGCEQVRMFGVTSRRNGLGAPGALFVLLPLRVALVVLLLLPDRNARLELVDAVVHGLQRVGPMRGGHGYDYARLANGNLA